MDKSVYKNRHWDDPVLKWADKDFKAAIIFKD